MNQAHPTTTPKPPRVKPGFFMIVYVKLTHHIPALPNIAVTTSVPVRLSDPGSPILLFGSEADADKWLANARLDNPQEYPGARVIRFETFRAPADWYPWELPGFQRLLSTS